MKNQIFSGYKIFRENPGLKFSYNQFFFYRMEFLQFRQKEYKSFFLVNEKENSVDAEVHFSIEGDKAQSLSFASFGSVQMKPSMEEGCLENFILNVEDMLLDEGISRLFIKHYPFEYSKEESKKLIRVFRQLNYLNAYTDKSYHIDLSLSFESELLQSEKNRLRKAEKNKVQCGIWPDPDLDRVYHILKVCRQAKGYPMSLSLSDFKSMFQIFPDVYTVFKAEIGGNIIAVAVTVHINSEILYNFYLGDDPIFRIYSPVVPLVAEMVSYAGKNNYRVFDLGISTDTGIVNEGLTQFKINLGGKVSDKPVFEKALK